MAGLTASLATSGALCATFPLALAVESFGWRCTFLFLAGVTFLLAVSVGVFVRNHPPGMDRPRSDQQKIKALSALRAVLSGSSFWGIAFLFFCSTGTLLTIQGLWGGPYLIDVFGMTPAQAGGILLAIPIGYMVGSPIAGLVSDRLLESRKKTIFIWVSLYLLTVLLLVSLRPGHSFLLIPVYGGIGFFGSAGPLLLAHLKDIFPRPIVGTALTCGNFFAMGGAAVQQFVTGLLIGRHQAVDRVYPLQAYREAFLYLAVFMALALLVYLRFAQAHPVELSEKIS